ncbi:hypothetical protein CTI12_AA555590 [Artemisia annua]|uniref:Uncharacterized protein n=1 Tax=Artemisia annua TaxID=35608 RepID=A0A2U1KWT4_ARTAN|nr:hypothetical protein CTI12_AA555590 [Artemisia annua]
MELIEDSFSSVFGLTSSGVVVLIDGAAASSVEVTSGVMVYGPVKEEKMCE